MTNNHTLPKGLFEACNKFYRAFDHMPTQIYVNWHRKVHLPPYINVPVILTALQMVSMIAENDPGPPKANFVSVPFTAEDWKDTLRYSTKTGSFVGSGLEWEDFALYSSKVGKVKPEDLKLSAELVKRMLDARGYKALISEAHSTDAYDVFYIFNGDEHTSWAISKSHYEVAYIETIKAEIDFALNKFLT